MNENTHTRIDETSPEMADALRSAMAEVFGQEVEVGPWNSGGGVMILSADLSIDGRGMGRQVWLTLDEDSGGRPTWLVGFYADDSGDEDSGEVVALLARADDPLDVARRVGRILRVLGVTTLEGA